MRCWNDYLAAAAPSTCAQADYRHEDDRIRAPRRPVISGGSAPSAGMRDAIQSAGTAKTSPCQVGDQARVSPRIRGSGAPGYADRWLARQMKIIAEDHGGRGDGAASSGHRPGAGDHSGRPARRPPARRRCSASRRIPGPGRPIPLSSEVPGAVIRVDLRGRPRTAPAAAPSRDRACPSRPAESAAGEVAGNPQI